MSGRMAIFDLRRVEVRPMVPIVIFGESPDSFPCILFGTSRVYDSVRFERASVVDIRIHRRNG